MGGKWGCIFQSECSFLAHCGEGGAAVERVFFPYFPLLKPRCVLGSEKYGMYVCVYVCIHIKTHSNPDDFPQQPQPWSCSANRLDLVHKTHRNLAPWNRHQYHGPGPDKAQPFSRVKKERSRWACPRKQEMVTLLTKHETYNLSHISCSLWHSSNQNESILPCLR